MKQYWDAGNKPAAFMLYFSCHQDWEMHCYKLNDYWPQIEECSHPKDFQAIAKELLQL